ncbi:hypothetical protein T06_6459, partial [Trichinella sp. T6]
LKNILWKKCCRRFGSCCLWKPDDDLILKLLGMEKKVTNVGKADSFEEVEQCFSSRCWMTDL